MSDTTLAPEPTPPSTTLSLPPVDSLLDDHTPPDAVGAAGEGADVPVPVLETGEPAPLGADDLEPHWGQWRLPAVTVPENLRLQTAVARLVVQKQRIDAIVREGQLDGLWPSSWLALDGRSIDLSAFVQSVLPFIPENGQGQTAPGRVNLKYTLGDDSRWGRDQVERPGPLAARLAADDCAQGGRDGAEVSLISPLGLCVPIQGKSRVGFLRQMGATSMAARVTALAYPSASQLGLYAVAPGGQPQVWCVLGQRQVRRLEAHWLSVPLLNGYGVPEPKPWPENWPPAEAVAQALSECRGNNCVPEVDLVALSHRLTREALGQRWVSTNLLQMRNWLPRWRFFLSSFIGLPVLLLLIAMLALPRPIEAAAVAAVLGFAGGAIAALAVPWVLARQRDVN